MSGSQSFAGSFNPTVLDNLSVPTAHIWRVDWQQTSPTTYTITNIEDNEGQANHGQYVAYTFNYGVPTNAAPSSKYPVAGERPPAIQFQQQLSTGPGGAYLPFFVLGGTPSDFLISNQTVGNTYYADLVQTDPNAPAPHAGEVFGQNNVTVTCFAAGTRIATPDGEAAVEALRPGDAALTAAGAAGRIVWTGQRRIDCARHAEPELVWPVRIAADAFGPGAPSRDLYLSPDHAVFVDGVLIPVRLLLNGDSIAQVARQSVTYHHVELETHDVILAEGLPAETYLDTGNRALLDESVAALRPDFAPVSAQAERAARSCAPLATEPASVRPIWLRLAARSAALAPVAPALAKAG